MNVGEMIEKLQKLNPALRVKIYEKEPDAYVNVTDLVHAEFYNKTGELLGEYVQIQSAWIK